MPSRRVSDRVLESIGGRYTEALCAADAPAVEAIVGEALGAGVAPTTIQVCVITQGMRRIGDMRERGELTIADEHRVTEAGVPSPLSGSTSDDERLGARLTATGEVARRYARLGTDRRGALLNADTALYAAKGAGRNRTQVTAAP